MDHHNHIENLKCQLRSARLTVEQLQFELEQAKKSCKHVFVMEDDGDYHNRSYYYVCKHCEYVTRMKPISQ